MEKTTLGLMALLGAAAVTPAVASAPATTVDRILRPTSIAELLDPIANPLAVLNDLSERQERTLAPVEVADAEISIGVPGIRIYHHHHHRRAYIYRHHHHYHHHMRRYHHHLHHHHHNEY